MADQGSNRKVANSLVVLSSAAIVAVYGAGFARTRAAADRFSRQDAERRSRAPVRHEMPAGALRPSTAPAPAPIAVDQQASRVDRALIARADSPRAADVTAPAAHDAHAEEHKATAPTPSAEALPSPAPATESAPEATIADAAPVAAPSAASENVAPSAPAAAVPADTAVPTAKFRDGTYLGWGTSRHGDIQAVVVVESGRITTARVAQCLTRYSCAWVEPIPPVILKQQGPTYDYVSGATESSDAFQTAVADALSHAR